jgi:DNA-binding response OmpR family regulator
MQDILPLPPHTPARVLVVVDGEVLARLIALTLDHGVYLTRVAPTAAAAVALLEQWRPHLVLLDMDIGAEQILARIGTSAERATPLPVLALTRRGDLQAKLQAFERGVDDILTVPFSPEELVARTLALMRRTYRASLPFSPRLTVGELQIDILHRKVQVGATELHLTSLEQALLYLLAANAGRVLSRDEILDHLWGTDFVADSNLVDRHIRNLRAKLQNGWRHPRFIATVPGQGYRFLPVEPEGGRPPA